MPHTWDSQVFCTNKEAECSIAEKNKCIIYQILSCTPDASPAEIVEFKKCTKYLDATHVDTPQPGLISMKKWAISEEI